MALKYLSDLSTCPDQPCPATARFQRRARVAFRILHAPAAEEIDFVPPAKKFTIRRPTCESYALSFFATLEQARRQYASLAKRVDAESRYGRHIGEIALLAVDGVMSHPDGDGHIDLHQEDTATFVPRVTQYHDAA